MAMNRRQFTKGLTTLAASPLMPLSAIGAASAETVLLHQSVQPYNWAAFIARVHNKASVKMFKRHLNLDDDQAHDVLKVLLREKVIAAPNPQGISQCAEPFVRGISTLGNVTKPFVNHAGKGMNVPKPKTPNKSTSINPDHKLRSSQQFKSQISLKDNENAPDNLPSVNSKVSQLEDDEPTPTAIDQNTQD